MDTNNIHEKLYSLAIGPVYYILNIFSSVFIGKPMYFMEAALGQFAQVGGTVQNFAFVSISGPVCLLYLLLTKLSVRINTEQRLKFLNLFSKIFQCFGSISF